MLRSYFVRVGIAVSAFSKAVRLSNFAGSLQVVRFLMAIPTEPPKKSRRRPESLLWEGQALNRSYILSP